MVAGILLVLLSPVDKELGSVLKLIYFHGALIVSGLFLFTGAGLVSLISLFRKSSDFSLLIPIEKRAIVFWIAAIIAGNIASQLAWGGIFWNDRGFRQRL